MMVSRQVLIILVLSQIIHSQAITLSSSRDQLVIDDEAIRKLSEIFDIPNLKRTQDVRAQTFLSVNSSGFQQDEPLPYSKWTFGKDKVTQKEEIMADQRNMPEPPEYMVNLFNTIADRNGIMRIPNPYHANLIKSFPNKNLASDERLQFDLSSIHFRETILQAELHLVIMRVDPLSPSAQPSVGNTANTSAHDHLFIQVYLIENIFPMRRRLIARKSLSATSSGIWLKNGSLSDVVTIRPAVLEWINRPHHNFGLQVSVTSDVRDVAGGEVIPIKIEKAAGKIPVLILFMDDGRPERNPKYRIKSSTKQNEYLKNRLTRLGQGQLYDSYTAADQLTSSLPIRPSSTQDLDAQDIFRIFPLSSRVKRSRKSVATKDRQRKKQSRGKKYRGGPSKGLRGGCRRHELYVSFEEIGWSSWIISPKGFQAFHCRGDCHFPIGQESKPSNHATVISIINHLKLHKNVAAPCCVPEKLYSISLLYFDNEQNVILKQYDDMVAQSCACR